MSRFGYRAISEQTLADDWGVEIPDGSSKVALLSRLRNESSLSQVRFLALVDARIMAISARAEDSAIVRTNVHGELYDLATNQFLGGFEMTPTKYEVSQECVTSFQCVVDSVEEGLTASSTALGEALSAQLERDAPPDDPAVPSVMYKVTLRDFDAGERLAILSVMIDEFPGYISHEEPHPSGSTMRYGYLTTASASDLVIWLFILLDDLGFDLGRDIVVHVQGVEVTVERKKTEPQ